MENPLLQSFFGQQLYNFFSMIPTQNVRYLIKNDACEFDLQQTFNQLSMFALNLPEIPPPPLKQTYSPLTAIPIPLSNSPTSTQQTKYDLVEVLSDIKGLKNTLRYIKLSQRFQKNKVQNLSIPKEPQGRVKTVPIDRQLFIRPTQSVINGPIAYWMIRGLKESTKKKLNLDSPTFVLTFNTSDTNSNEGDQLLVTIERKCLTLYEIDHDEIQLTDYDSVSLEKKLIVVEMKHALHEGRHYVLIFGNEKEKKQDFFKCMVYEIKDQRFIFVKKNILWKGQIYSPTILFESYPKNQKQKYCLIVGGCRDSKNVMLYQALQVDMHLMISSWLTYPTELTKQVAFDSKRQSILSGKAIKYNDFWYIFCTQNQTITQIRMDYQHGIWLDSLHLLTLSLELKEKIFFSEQNLFLTLKQSLKLIMLNANLEFREKDFMEIVERFDTH